MPIQAPQWTDYLNCPVCCREFGPPPRSPISLGCGHTLCKQCLQNLHKKQCPFDQTVIQAEPEELVVNTALLQLAGYSPPAQPFHPPCIQALPDLDQQAYDIIVRCLEQLALYLKLCASNNIGGSRLSRPMQRKLVTLLQCAITDEEGRGRAARAARSLGERTVTELILQHQNPQQLSANLWAAVRARGCQFLGPAMQEEVLKLVLLALEDGSALSRKVLVMFVVQRLEPHFPQASKTSIGHVVQLLYRASCFKVSKRESDSSLMQLKDEFRTYDALRREHDAQIVQIATEAGLRIAPDQWSALLYGDTAHKSHMQSIIDKLQTPQSFAQSVQELFIALQRTGDPAQLVLLNEHLDRLASIDSSPDAKCPTWAQLAEIINAIKEVVSGLVHYLQQQAAGRDANHNQKHTYSDRPMDPNTLGQPSPQTAGSTPTHKYKMSMCRDAVARSFCPRGNACTFAHFEEEMERYRMSGAQAQAQAAGGGVTNGNYAYLPVPAGVPLPALSQPLLQPLYARYPLPPHPHTPHPPHTPHAPHTPHTPHPPHTPLPVHTTHPPHTPLPLQHPHLHIETYNVPPVQLPPSSLPQDMNPSPEIPRNDNIQSGSFTSPILHTQVPMAINHNGLIIPIPERPYYGRYGGILTIDDSTNNIQYPRPEYASPVYQGPSTAGGPMPGYQGAEQNVTTQLPNMFIPVQHEPGRNISPYTFDDLPSDLLPDYRAKAPGFAPIPQRDRILEPTWPPSNNVFTFDNIRNALPHCQSASDDMFNVSGDRRAVGADRLTVSERLAAATADLNNRADDQELEEELQALERRIDTEFKSTD